MHTATVAEIRKELKLHDKASLIKICSRLAAFKKENKELLTYLLFESGNEEGYRRMINESISTEMRSLNTSSLYFAKKGIRKIVRNLNKYIRYSGDKETEAVLRIHFLKELKATGIRLNRSRVLTNIYEGQLRNTKKAVAKLHEDLQYDYGLTLEGLAV